MPEIKFSGAFHINEKQIRINKVNWKITIGTAEAVSYLSLDRDKKNLKWEQEFIRKHKQ